MTLRKKIKSRFKLALRRVGMLCKRPQEPKNRIRIKKTFWPDGIWNEIHKDVNKSKTNK